jgi:hypothetical protein
MSTAIVVSPYESMVVDYLQEIEGYFCKTDVQFLFQKSDIRGRKRNVRCDIDILAFHPKKESFLVCEVVSYTPTAKKDKEKIKQKIQIISNGNLRDFLKKHYGINKYGIMLVTWTATPWLKKQFGNSSVRLLTFKEITQRLIDYLKKKRGVANGWVGVSNLTLLVLQTVLHFRERGELEI